MDQVWILEQGEDYEGGSIVGVYTDRELGFKDFYETVTGLPFWTRDEVFGRKRDMRKGVWREESDGSVHAHAGCDWVSYSPFPVTNQRQIDQ